MCGRYFIDDETVKEIEKLVHDIDYNIRIGEIYPTNQVPIFTNNNSSKCILSTWGFPNFHNKDNKGVIINARSETAFEKPMFKQSLIDRRCLIPASGFFEWNSEKEKYYFTSKEAHTFYFCGLYNTFENENRFVILTTSPNISISDIHDRMPLILPKSKCDDWLYNNAATQLLLKETPILLDRSSDYEQQTLF